MEIQHQDLSYEIYKQLKSMILVNDFEPGAKLKQEHIATMFGVSRMPLHRAFQMLENEMLIESVPRRGYFVTKIKYSQLIDDNLLIILFDRFFPDVTANIIIVDNFGGAHGAIHHFIENGFKNIAFVTIESTQIQMEERLSGYMKAFAENELEPCFAKIPFPLNHDAIAEKVKSFLEENPQLDAVMFATNYLAIGGLKAIIDLGLNIPKDLAVIGFDDNYHFELFSPAITIVSQPVEEISRQIVKKMLASLAEDVRKINIETIVLPTKLIIRQSSVKNSIKKRIKRS